MSKSLREQIRQLVQERTVDKTLLSQGVKGLICLFSDSFRAAAHYAQIKHSLTDITALHSIGISAQELSAEGFARGVEDVARWYNELKLTDNRFVLAVFLSEDEQAPEWLGQCELNRASCLIIRVMGDFSVYSQSEYAVPVKAEYIIRPAETYRHLDWVLLLERRDMLLGRRGAFALSVDYVDATERAVADDIYLELIEMSSWQESEKDSLMARLKKAIDSVGDAFIETLPPLPSIRAMPIELERYRELSGEQLIAKPQKRGLFGVLSLREKSSAVQPVQLEPLFGRYRGGMLLSYYFTSYAEALEYQRHVAAYESSFSAQLSLFYKMPYTFIVQNYIAACEKEISRLQNAAQTELIAAKAAYDKPYAVNPDDLGSIHGAFAGYENALCKWLRILQKKMCWQLAKAVFEDADSALRRAISLAVNRIAEQKTILSNMGVNPDAASRPAHTDTVLGWNTDISRTLEERSTVPQELKVNQIRTFINNLRLDSSNTIYEHLKTQVLFLYDTPAVDALSNLDRRWETQREWMKIQGIGKQQIIALLFTPIEAYRGDF